MSRSFRWGLALLTGLALLVGGLALHSLLGDPTGWLASVGLVGCLLVLRAGWALRGECAGLLRGRRGQIAAFTVGVVGVFLALAYLSVRYPFRFDLTESRRFSLSPATVAMLQKLQRPVHVVFFHDPLMRETVELYELIARQTPRVTVEFYDPVINPARARLLGVNFAGTAVLESEGRRLEVNSPSEVDIANGILRVSQAATQHVCFLDGHNEPDPFSLEAHDHMEGTPGHSHGLGARYVLHERHGMAKARHALETLNYTVEKVLLLQRTNGLAGCALLVVAGPKVPLLPREVEAVRAYLAAGRNALFLLDPFVTTGLEPLLREYGVVVDDDIVIDEASHFWTDVSAPAVSDYNRHQITRDLPVTFFPGARSLSPTAQRVPGTAVIPLVNSSKNSWGQANRQRVGFVEGRDVRGPSTLMAIALRRPVAADGTPAEDGPRSRIAVVGDSDFATNSFFHIMGNGTLFVNTVSFLTAQDNLIGLPPRTADLPRVNLTNRQMKGTFVLSVVLVPALLAMVGTAVWWKQH